jgi:hypothetical protein
LQYQDVTGFSGATGKVFSFFSSLANGVPVFNVYEFQGVMLIVEAMMTIC